MTDLDPIVMRHHDHDPDTTCQGMLREFDRTGVWQLTACDQCGTDVAFRRDRDREPASVGATGKEWGW